MAEIEFVKVNCGLKSQILLGFKLVGITSLVSTRQHYFNGMLQVLQPSAPSVFALWKTPKLPQVSGTKFNPKQPKGKLEESAASQVVTTLPDDEQYG